MQDSHYKPSHTNLGAKLSIAGHLFVFFVAISWAYLEGLFKFEKKETPPVIELVPFSEQKIEQKESPKTNIDDFNLKQIQELKPLEIPTHPEKQIEVKPEEIVEKKVVVTEKNVVKPTKTSYKDFLKQHGEPKEKKRSSSKVNPVKIDKVKIDVKSFYVKVSNSSQTAGATQNELQAYYALVYAKLKQNWIKPEDCVGMDLTTNVSIRITERGKCVNVRIVSSSGVKSFDDAVVKLFNSITLPVPPRAKSLNITIAFDIE